VKGTIARAANKVRNGLSGPKARCQSPRNDLALAEFSSCPSPSEASDDASGPGIDNFTDVGECHVSLFTDGLVPYRRSILAPDAAAIVADPDQKQILACGSALAKGATAAWRAMVKTLAQCQEASDDNGGAYDFNCSDTSDAQDELTKLYAKIDEECAVLSRQQLANLGSCGKTRDELILCFLDAITQSATGLAAASFEMPALCPDFLRTFTRASAGVHDDRELEIGWRGAAHHIEASDIVSAGYNVSCSDGDCGSCSLTLDCPASGCRCDNDPSIYCANAYVSGGVCGAGTCAVFTGPPRPASIGTVPVCLMRTIDQPLSGTADFGRGAFTLNQRESTDVYLGITQFQPCPICDQNIGQCVGGENDGGPCGVDAVDPTFGNLSYSCPPSTASNITTAAPASANVVLSTGSASLAAGDACDPPLAMLNCACGVCENDQTLTCNGDGDCPGITGPCSQGLGEDRRPNNCSTLTCTNTGGEEGICTGSSFDNQNYCDGVKYEDGRGFLGCLNNGDCTVFGPEAGLCTLTDPNLCFLNPIDAPGKPGPTSARLAGTYCTTATSNSSVNITFGLPGPARQKVEVAVEPYCGIFGQRWVPTGWPCP
jgi:hypothetical protein